MIFSNGLARFTFVCVNRVSVACQRFPVQGSDVLSVNLKCGPSNFVHTIPHGPPRCLATINSRSTDSAFPASKITISASCLSASLHCAPRFLAWRGFFCFLKRRPLIRSTTEGGMRLRFGCQNGSIFARSARTFRHSTGRTDSGAFGAGPLFERQWSERNPRSIAGLSS